MPHAFISCRDLSPLALPRRRDGSSALPRRRVELLPLCHLTYLTLNISGRWACNLYYD